MSGILAAGADCSQTGHEDNTEMDVKELIEFLEAGAMCMSSEDRMKEKTAIESACYKLGDRCTFEIKESIKRMATIQKSLK